MNIEINDLLCYVSTAVNSIDYDTIVSTCVAFYGAVKIKEAKQRLAVLMKEEIKWRRGDDRIKSEMQDIVDLLSSARQSGKVLPKFVAESFNSMPPSSGFEIIGEGLSNLMEELSNLREEVMILKNIRSNDSKLTSELISLKENIVDIKKKLNSLNKEVKANNYDNKVESSLEPHNYEPYKHVEVYENCNIVPSAPPASQIEAQELSMGIKENLKEMINKETNISSVSWADIASSSKERIIKNDDLKVKNFNPQQKSIYIDNMHTEKGYQEKNKDREGFTLVKSKRKMQLVYGKKNTDPENSLKCAKSYLDLYVGRCDLNVEEDHIKDYIKEQLNIDILSINKLNCRNPMANSFKITVSRDIKDDILNEEFWPLGIICRRFYSNKNNGGTQR